MVTRPSGLQPVEEITYGDFTFPASVNAKLSGRPAYNDADNQAIYTDYTLYVEGIIDKNDLNTGGDSADETISLMRLELTEANRGLTLRKTGFGHIFITATGFGGVGKPTKPRLIELTNLGSGKAIHLIWQVDFSIQDCTNTTGLAALVSATGTPPLIRHDVDVVYDVDERDNLIKTHNVVLEYATPLVANFFTDNNGQKLLAAVNKTFFGGYSYTNTTASVKFSSDRRIVTITYKQEQIDTGADVLPPGVQEADGTHEVSGGLDDGGYAMWTNDLTITLSAQRGVSKNFMFQKALAIVRSRILKGASARPAKNWYGKTIYQLVVPIITNFTITDHLFSKDKVTFNISWRNGSPLNELIQRTGLFEPIAFTSQAEWGANRQAKRGGTRRDAPLFSRRNYPSFVYPWSTSSPRCKNDDRGPSANQSAQIGYEDTFVFLGRPICPPADTSWVDYKVNVKQVTNRNYKKHKKYKAVAIAKASSSETSSRYQTLSDRNYERSDGNDDFQQVTGSADQQLIVKGYAVRYNGTTDPPDIASYAGVKVELVDEEIESVQLSSGDCPLYLTKWVKIYDMLAGPNQSKNLPYEQDRAIKPGLYQNQFPTGTIRAT